jgi:branched-chain amino acid transport system ATP-binding protein
MTIININNLETGYRKKQVIFGINIEVNRGEIVALIGPNGAGKSTVLKAICGLIPTWKGEIHFNGSNITSQSPAAIIKNGITFAAQGSRIFDELTVIENLEIGGIHLSKRKVSCKIEELFNFFPILKERRKCIAGQLSGGEQQMLSLARALIPGPQLMMLDEPSLGLAPNLINEIFDRIKTINLDMGTSILVVEQKVREVLKLSSRVYSLKLGQVAYFGSSDSLRQNDTLLKELFL